MTVVHHATRPPTRRWRRGLAFAAAGALAIVGAEPAAQALSTDEAEAEGRLLSGGGAVNLNAIAALAPAYSAHDSDSGIDQNPLSLDVLNALGIDLGDGIQLFGPSGIIGVGALGQYARTGAEEVPFASSGAVNADGSIALAPSDPSQNAFLDLAPLLGMAELDSLLDDARLELGALSASATVDADGAPVGDYQIADGTLLLTSPAIAALSGAISDVLGDVSDPINDLLGEEGAINGALQPSLDGLASVVNGVLQPLGSVDDLGVNAGIDLDLQAAVDSVLEQPLTS